MNRGPSKKGDFARRLGIYLFGVALGLVLLGMMQRLRAQQMQQAQPTPQAPAGPASPGDP